MKTLLMTFSLTFTLISCSRNSDLSDQSDSKPGSSVRSEGLSLAGTLDGKRYYATIHEGELNELSKWQRNNTRSAITPETACKLATVIFEKEFPQFGDYVVHNQLKKLESGAWLYYVTFTLKELLEEGDKQLMVRRLTYLVLPTSKVISPKERS